MKRLKENSNQPHILIIGGGIIGKFNALELSELGYQITIADPSRLNKNNSSNAALGLLMGNIYQKREGRSWVLRKQSIELWPKWIKVLQEFNKELNIEKPLIQLTTNEEKFKKLKEFVKKNTKEGLEILNRDSLLIRNLNNAFQTNNIKGIISLRDGRIEPVSLLKTLDICLKNKKVEFLEDEIIEIKKLKKQWISSSRNNNTVKSDAVILCNSLDAVKLFDYETNKIKLKPVLGQAIELSTDEKEIDILSLPKHFNINGKNIIRIAKNKIIIGSTDEYSRQAEDNVFEKLTDFLEKTPKWITKEKISKTWFGIRSRPEGEASPILKILEDRLILCTGFYKNGFLLAPACSNWVLNEIKKQFD